LENRDGRPKEDAEGTVGDTGKCEFATGRLWQMQKDLWDIQGDLGKVQNDLGEFKEIFWRLGIINQREVQRNCGVGHSEDMQEDLRQI
jgi:hypothetical protein